MSDATPSTDARVAPALPHQPPPARRVSLFKSASLGTRLGMVMAVLLASIATFLAAYLPAEFDRLGRLGFLEQTEGIARMLATASEAALDFDDALSASRQLEALSSLPDVNYARLLRPDGTTLAGLHPERMPGDLPLGAQEMQSRLEPRAVQVVVPVPSRSGHPGALAVGFSLDALEKARARASLRVLEVSAAVLLFGLLAAAALGTLLTTPLRRVTSVAERIADGDAGARGDLELDRRDEVGRLAQAFDLMLQRLFGQRGRIDALNGDLEKRVGELGRANSELAEKMEELRRTQAQLIVSDRRSSVATLAAGAAHEINNPLSYVIANIDFVAEKVLPLVTPEIQSALTDAIEGARRVQGIVRALKTLSSTGENEESVPLDIKAPLEAAIHMAQNEIRHRARLVQELRPVPPVLGLEVQLGQVFLNLLINAAQAIPHGASNKHEVRVSTRVDERGQVVIEIADTGSGISEETRARLFVPFFTTKPIGVGTGLGLFIVQGIVQRHGGEITVESEVGRGSVFRVSLPPASASAARKKSSGPGITPPVRRGRILVIDDEPKVCSTIQRILGEHEVHTTCDARDGLSRLQAGERFDLILCDVMMPEMSGPDFDLAVRALDPALFARTYFISGGAFTDTTRAFIAANEHRLFDKPLDFVRLKGVLRALLG